MKWLMAALALAGATPLAARDLPVPADKGWKHAETGLILMPQLAGMRRTGLTDATASEHDVAAQFETSDGSVFATVYLFRPAIADVPLWFDRSQTAIDTRDLFRHAAPATADPVAFAVGGARAASSLRQLYSIPDGRYRSTALAVIPLGEWIVSIRMSAATLTADQLDGRLLQVIAAIRWPPATDAAAVAAVPIRGCATPLAFGKAKQIKPAGADMLMSLIGGMAVAKEPSGTSAPAPRRSWCREGEATKDYGVYRSGGDEGYVLALYDAGRVVSVYPSLMGQIDHSGNYSVSLEDVDRTVSTFPSFSALPAPRQVWTVVGSGQRTGTAKGNQVTIDPKVLK